MRRAKTIPADLKGHRHKSGENQREFWSRFGVTQSAGSRYETERELPVPVQMLMWLELNGRIDDGDLQDALTSVVKTYLRRQANTTR